MAEASSIAILQAIPCDGAVVEFKYSLPSVVAVMPRVIDALISRTGSFRLREDSEDDIELALQEALPNAVIHGKKEDPFRRVYVTLRCSADGEVQITIQDEGAGFDLDSVPDPTAPEHVFCIHGRGVSS